MDAEALARGLRLLDWSPPVKRPDHVRLRSVPGGPPVVWCSHCGSTEQLPPLPADLGDFAKNLDALAALHVDCPPPAESEP